MNDPEAADGRTTAHARSTTDGRPVLTHVATPDEGQKALSRWGLRDEYDLPKEPG